MALIRTITGWDLKDAMRECGRDYYTIDACDRIVDYYDECGTNIELDPIAIACDFNEESFDYVVEQYGHLDNITDVSDIDTFIEELNYYTYAVKTCGDYILYINF